MRLSESSFSSRLSEVSAGDGTFDANSRTFNVVDSPERSHPPPAVADPSTSNGAFQLTTKSSSTMTLPNTTTTTPGDVNHNISNGNGSTSGEPDL